MQDNIRVLSGTLEIVESLHGYMLYGDTAKYGVIFLAHMGDGVDSIVSSPGYDPNDDHDLAEAYGFTFVRERRILGQRVWEEV